LVHLPLLPPGRQPSSCVKAIMFSFCLAPKVDTFEVLDAPPRTAKDKTLAASEALAMLKEGNARYVGGRAMRPASAAGLRTALAEKGQNPVAVVIGCADSRCPIETTFDAQPGDIFVLRNAGNACLCGEGSIVASAEYATAALGTQLLVVMGHTKCGAMVGATKLVVGPDANAKKDPESLSALEKYLDGLTPACKEAAQKLGAGASVDDVAASAIRLNAFRTIKSLVEHSPALSEKVRSGAIEMHGAVYNIETGAVEFLGQHPDLAKGDKAFGA